jgi:hypothetical protein
VIANHFATASTELAPTLADTPSSTSLTNLHVSQQRRSTETFEALKDSYITTKEVVDVSFRDLVGPIPVNDSSHSIYPYPARLLRQIPRFFLRCAQLVSPGDLVLDPFCGSGTVLVEARAANLNGWGIDSNPFARLLTEVKTTPLGRPAMARGVEEVTRQAKASRAEMIPDVVNVDLWFSPIAKTTLGRLQRAISRADLPETVRSYLFVCLAVTAEKSSLRDQRIPVPVRRKDWQAISDAQSAPEIWSRFETASNHIGRCVASVPLNKAIRTIVRGDDASQAHAVFEKSLADKLSPPRLIVTSPPYGAAQKYIRSCSLSLGWTNLAKPGELAGLEQNMIGKEHVHQSARSDLTVPSTELEQVISRVSSSDALRAAIYAEYFRSMDQAIRELVSLLAPDGHLVLVAGTNTVSGQVLHTHRHLRDMVLSHGLSMVLEVRDAIRGRVLLTKRAMNGAPLQSEHIYVFRKASS